MTLGEGAWYVIGDEAAPAPEPPPSTALAMPRGPVNGFAQAADFYDSVGICHHPEYLGDAASAVAIQRIQELGLRHVRLGMYSPANHGEHFQYVSGRFGLALRDANATRAPGVQPISALWGTTEEPRYEQNRGSAVYTMQRFLRPLDGPAGDVPDRWGPSPLDGANAKLENVGAYYGQGWETAGGLQGPNEPDNNRQTFWEGAGSVRATLRGLKDSLAARSDVVLAGADYVASDTGRITPGPAYAHQLPTVAPHLVGNNWHVLGDYSDGEDVDVGCRHTYWGGHGPNWTELQGHWAGSTSYAGLPRFCTEMGQHVRLPDPGAGVRYVPPEVGGVYNTRSLIVNYLQNVRRTFVYKLSHESGDSSSPWVFGGTDHNLVPNASFHQLGNLLELVGFQQGATSTPLAVTVTGFTPGPAKTLSDGYVMPDDLRWVVLQQPDGYLILIERQRELWDRGSQSYLMVPQADWKTITISAPGLVAAAVAEPDKNPIKDPVDGQTYANPGDGTAYAPLTVSGGQTQLVMAGLTRAVKLTVG